MTPTPLNCGERAASAALWRRLVMIAALAFGLPAAALAAAAADTLGPLQSPAVPGEGGMHPLPHAAYQPDPNRTYKIVFAISRGSDKPGKVNPGLEMVARAVNLYVPAGVPLDHLKVVAVLYDAATGAALDAAHYKSQFDAEDPNLALIHKLRAAGVDVAVCAQAVLKREYSLDWVNPEVTVALSAVTTITMLQAEGYVLFPA